MLKMSLKIFKENYEIGTKTDVNGAGAKHLTLIVKILFSLRLLTSMIVLY